MSCVTWRAVSAQVQRAHLKSPPLRTVVKDLFETSDRLIDTAFASTGDSVDARPECAGCQANVLAFVQLGFAAGKIRNRSGIRPSFGAG
jgi:hypothetical protein